MKKVYVVVGSTGEYSDHYEWYVAAYLSETAAANRVRECQLFANELQARVRNYYVSDEVLELAKTGPDSQMSMDYNGTHYTIAEVDLVDSP